MKDNSKKFYIKPLYKTANHLLRMEINTIEDVINFYIGVNNLASQISLNTSLIDELNSEKYRDNPSFLNRVSYILGYGQVLEDSKKFVQSLLPLEGLKIKEIKLYPFLAKIPQMKAAINIAQKEAHRNFKNFIDSLSKEDLACLSKFIDVRVEDKVKEEIDKFKEEHLSGLENTETYYPMQEEFSVGPLEYKGQSIYYEEINMDLPPQLVRLCAFFMEQSKKEDPFAQDEDIEEIVSAKKRISKENMKKLVSKLRGLLKIKNENIKIKRISKGGYIFMADNIH